jgi:hypothetical protein
MRLVLVVLLLANVVVAILGVLGERQAGGEPQLLENQLNADKILIVRDAPEPAPAGAPACLEWGPFGAEELARAREALVPLGLAERLTSAPVMVSAGWWVHVPPLKTREAAERKLRELEALGIRDSYLVQERGPWEHAISLGVFRNQDGAERFADELRAKGAPSVAVAPRVQQVRLTALYLRDPAEAEARRLVELQPAFAGTSVRAGPCP